MVLDYVLIGPSEHGVAGSRLGHGDGLCGRPTAPLLYFFRPTKGTFALTEPGSMAGG